MVRSSWLSSSYIVPIVISRLHGKVERFIGWLRNFGDRWFDMSIYIQEHGEQVYQPLFKYADLLLPISNFWKDRLIELGYPPTMSIVQRVGIDTEKFNFSIIKKPNGKGKLLSICRLIEKKGITYSIKAFKKVINSSLGSSAEYNIVGDGEEKEKLIGKRDWKERLKF